MSSDVIPFPSNPSTPTPTDNRNLAADIPQEGYHALGNKEGGWSVVWSYGLKMQMEVGPKDLFQGSLLTRICNIDWLIKRYPKKDRDGAVTSFSVMAAGGDLDKACKEAGPYALTNTVGCGVWRDGADFIVNSKEIFYASDYAPAARFSEDRIFLATHDLGIRPGQAAATKEECSEILDLLNTFSWETGAPEAKRVLGWLATAYAPAAMRKRTHIFICSAREGAGKSSIAELAEFLLGGAAMTFSGPTESGIRQTFAQIAGAAIVDESGADAKPDDLIDNVRYFRSTYDGKSRSKGTAGHLAKKFEMRSCGMLLGVEFPISEDQGQDNSRFLKCRLLPYETFKIDGRLLKGSKPVHHLFPSHHTEKALRELGKRVFARMLKSLPRFDRAYDLIFQCIQASGRVSTSLAPILAGYFVLLNDHELTEKEAAKLVLDAKLEDEIKRMSAVDPGAEFREALMTMSVPPHILQPHHIKPMLFQALFDITTYHKQGANELYQNILHDLGMHMRPRKGGCNVAKGELSHELCFRLPITQNLKDLFKNHPKFSISNLKERIGCIDGMREGQADVNFGGGGKNTLAIPFAQPPKSALRIKLEE